MSSKDFKVLIADVLENVAGVKNPEIEFASNEIFGDYSTNVALKNKNLDVKKIVSKINSLNLPFNASFVDKFINFKLKNDILIDNLMYIDDDFGKSNLGRGKLVIVEYSSPNIAKPFGVGHLRSTVIGDAVANLMEAIGYKVMRDNHLGDWGTQFGKVIYAIEKWSNIQKIEKSENPVDELVSLYVRFHQESEKDKTLDDQARACFKKLEDGDSETRKLWQKCVDWSWVEFQKIYHLLGIKFDDSFNRGRGLGESFFENRIPEVIKELENKKLLKNGKDGAKLVFFGKDKYPPLMILKKDGTTLYSTRDLAADKYRLEKYKPDLIINEVGLEQSLYFKQIFEIEKILGWYEENQRVHVGHGLFLLDGKKMSTRAGKTIKLEDVLNEVIERAKKLGNKDEKIAKEVGIGAIKYFDLSHHPSTNIVFDWDKILSLESNSGPYIQYTIARINSLISKACLKGIKYKETSLKGVTLKDIEISILRKLAIFPEIVQISARSYSPNLICNYLFNLARKYNAFYNDVPILNSRLEAKYLELRLGLSLGVSQVLKNGLKILGIKTPKKM